MKNSKMLLFVVLAGLGAGLFVGLRPAETNPQSGKCCNELEQANKVLLQAGKMESRLDQYKAEVKKIREDSPLTSLELVSMEVKDRVVAAAVALAEARGQKLKQDAVTTGEDTQILLRELLVQLQAEFNKYKKDTKEAVKGLEANAGLAAAIEESLKNGQEQLNEIQNYMVAEATRKSGVRDFIQKSAYLRGAYGVGTKAAKVGARAAMVTPGAAIGRALYRAGSGYLGDVRGLAQETGVESGVRRVGGYIGGAAKGAGSRALGVGRRVRGWWPFGRGSQTLQEQQQNPQGGSEGTQETTELETTED